MKPSTLDPHEEAFVQRALTAATRAQRWDRARLIFNLAAAFSAAFWLASRPGSSELGTECTVVILIGTMLGVVAAKLRALINRNTVLVLQAIASLKSQSE